MDNVKLNREQLTDVVQFIQRRGFKEPLIVVEILDHFACMVEARITANSKLSLDEAIEVAHGDLGPLGFHSLRTAFEKAAYDKYGSIYRHACKKYLTDPVFLLSAVALSLLYGKGAVWGIGVWSVWGFSLNPVLEMSLICYFINEYIQFKRIPPSFRRNLLVDIIRSKQLAPAFVVGMISGSHPHSPSSTVALGVISALLFFYVFLSAFASRWAYKNAVEESAIVDNYLSGLQSASVA
jgi:hypothetical protein